MNFKQRVKPLFFIQLIVGLIAILFVVIGWQREYEPLFIVIANIFIIIMIILNGIERYILTKSKGYLTLTIIVSLFLLMFWLYRYSIHITFLSH